MTQVATPGYLLTKQLIDQINSGVTGVGATSPLQSSGGTSPIISLAGAIPVVDGGTGATTAAQALINLGAQAALGFTPPAYTALTAWSPEPVFPAGLTQTPGTGAITINGFYAKVGALVFVVVEITCTGNATTASAGIRTCYINNLPFAAAHSGEFHTWNDTSGALLGHSRAQSGTTNLYVADWTTTGNKIVISGWYLAAS